MIAEILSTGDEIRSGALVDSNSAYIAEKLEQIGVEVVRHNCVGDNLDILVSVFQEISQRCNIAIVTGGLGPTTDDLTTQAAAKAVGVELVLDETALQAIENFFKARNWPMTYSNKKQAILPIGSERIDNFAGTAPGFILKIGNCHFFCLPGVPYEMRKMLSDTVLPKIQNLETGKRKFCFVKNISTFGLGESATGERLAGLSNEFPEIKLGLRAKFPEIHIKLYANGEDQQYLNDLLEKACESVLQKIGNKVVSVQGESMEAVVGKLLCEKKATLALAESCTGGLIANRLTNIAGSSEFFLFSGVTYSNQAKMKVLNVSEQTLIKYGAVHEQTVKEMAQGARDIAGATYGLATSGIAGPDGGTDEKPVGTVCIGIASPETVKGTRYYFPFAKRLMNKSIFATTALDILRKELEQGI